MSESAREKCGSTLISIPSPNTKGHLNLSRDIEIQTNMETLVRSRRPNSKSNETLTSEVLKKLESVIVPTPQESSSNLDQVTDDLPIALRKQPRSCTLHPISKFVSYNALFIALEIPEWREAMME